MFVHRDDVKDRRYMVNIDHLQEAYKFSIPICADKFASVQIRAESLSYGINILPVVPEESAVSYSYAVIDSLNASYQIIIKRDNFHHQPTPGGAPYIFPRRLR